MRYKATDRRFSDNTDLPDRYLGVSWSTGDVLTYKIKPDDLHHRQHNRHICLARSAVGKDSGLDQRLAENRQDSAKIESVE